MTETTLEPRPGGEAGAISAERTRFMDYLQSRAASATAQSLRTRFQAAAKEFEATLADVTPEEAAWRPPDGAWSIAQVVDHLAQTTIRSAEELRHLLAGRRPPGPPVYESLTSGAPGREPWSALLEGLRAANHEFHQLLAEAEVEDMTETGTAAGAEPPTVRTILVVNRQVPGGAIEPEIFSAELSWREYVLVQRLHLLDHRTQVRKIRAALKGAPQGPSTT